MSVSTNSLGDPPQPRYEYPRKRPATEQTSLLGAPDIGSVASAATPSAPRSIFATLAGSGHRSPEQAVHRPLPDPETFAPHATKPETVAEAMQTNLTTGLIHAEAARRLAQFGPNSLQAPTLSLLHVVREELTEPLILLLLAVAVLYILWGRAEEAITAIIVVLLTVSLELWTEYRAKLAVLALSTSSFRPPVTCLREGGFVRLPAEQIVRGDVLEVSAGERLAADARVVAGQWLLVDESALTGESRPVSKDPLALLHPDVPAAMRRNMVHAGTLVTHGSARVVVTATGYQTQVGLILILATHARTKIHSARTPMQVAMKELALHLTVVTAVCCMGVMSLAFMRGLSYQTVVLMGLSLAFATIPEELPILIKAVLAVGALQLSRQNVLVKSLKTAEALGSISLLLTDKTGTLTRNELAVLRLAMPGRVLKVPRPPNPTASSGKASAPPALPFRASTEDMLAFEPLLAQGWLLSAPSLTDQLTSRAAGLPTTVPGMPSNAATRAALADRALDPAFNAGATLDGFDAAVLRFFAQKRSSAQDLNSTFLRRLFGEALQSAAASQLVHVLPYDALRRRSSTIRRVASNAGVAASAVPSAVDSSSGPSRSSTPSATAATSSSTTHPLQSGQLRLCTRGGAEFVLSACSYAVHADGGVIKLGSEAREELRSQLRKMADAGLRIMAFAVRRLEQSDLDRAAYQGAGGVASASPMPSEDEQSDASGYHTTPRRNLSASPALGPSSSSPHAAGPTLALASLEHSMTFLGFIGFGDSLRDGVASSVRILQGAGIEVKLVTGDFERTGAAVARAVGVLPPRGKSMPSSGGVTAAPAGNRFAQKPFSHQPSPYGQDTSEDEEDNTRRASKFPNTAAQALPTAALPFQSPPAPILSQVPPTGKRLSSAGSGRSRSASREAKDLRQEAQQMEGVCIGGLRCVSKTKEKRRSASKGNGLSNPSPSASPVAPTTTDFAIAVTLAQPPATPSASATPHMTPTFPRTRPPTGSPSMGTPAGGPLTPYSGYQKPVSSPTPSLSRAGSAASGRRAVYDLSARVFCRMTPQDKLNLVIRHRELGHVVLVTGDGANDAASLAAADAGLAMGSCGTDLAREMAGIILTDDDFRHVVVAVAEGRRTLDNLRKAVRFCLACKVVIVLLFFLPLAFGFDLPLSPLHVILLEAFLDLGASAAYTSEAPDGNLMTRKPSEWGKAHFMKGRRFWGKILVGAMLLLAAVGGVLYLAHQMEVVRYYSDSHYSQGASAHEWSDLMSRASSSHHSSSSSIDSAASSLPIHSTRAAPPPPPPSSSSTPSASSAPSGHHHAAVDHQHSSSSFFPSIIDEYHPDPHLALTQTLVLTAWLLASVMLATFMRTFGRSSLFGCCDRRAIKRWRAKRPTSSSPTAAAATDVDPQPTGFTRPKGGLRAVSSFVAAHQASYASLVAMESGTASDDRVDAAESGLGGVPEEERSDYSTDDSSDSLCPPDELEGLAKRSTSSTAAKHEKEWASSNLAELCPLMSNPVMLLWMVLSIGFGVAAVYLPWLRRTFALAPLNILVTMPRLTGERMFPAYVVLLLPIAIFVCAEFGKFVTSWTSDSSSSSSSKRNGKRNAAPYATTG